MMVNRKTANYVASAVFAILLIAGINLIIAVGPSFDAPKKTTTVVEIGSGTGRGKTTKSFEKQGRSKKKAGKRSITVERPTGKPVGKKTTTVEEGSRSFVERSLGKSGLIGLQGAIVVLAAFLGAALAQRVLIGDFSVKVGNLLELSATQDHADDSATALAAKVADLEHVVGERSKNQDALAVMTERTMIDTATTALALKELDGRIDEMERQIATLQKATAKGRAPVPPTAAEAETEEGQE
jgi:hypothetical protein